MSTALKIACSSEDGSCYYHMNIHACWFLSQKETVLLLDCITPPHSVLKLLHVNKLLQTIFPLHFFLLFFVYLSLL